LQVTQTRRVARAMALSAFMAARSRSPVIARSVATKQSSERRAAAAPLDCFRLAPLGVAMTVAGQSRSRPEFGSLPTGHRRSLAAPPAASRNSSAHGRSPGSRRIADAAFPDSKSSGEKASARRLQSRGRPRIGERPTVFPFHPLASRGTVRVYVPASPRVVKCVGARRLAMRRESC
jgi:hypothetical protein